jgi:anti-anti-sigma factor
MRLDVLTAEENDEVTLLEVEGVIDSVNVTDFFQCVNKLFKEDRLLIVMDMARASYLSSGALSVIADAFKKAKGMGGKLVLCGVPESLKELFSVVQFDRIFEFYDDLPSAVASFTK